MEEKSENKGRRDERRGGENGRLHDPILMYIISGTLCALFFRMTEPYVTSMTCSNKRNYGSQRNIFFGLIYLSICFFTPFIRISMFGRDNSGIFFSFVMLFTENF